MLLTLRHGQASLERCFSINKSLVCEHQSEKRLTARRVIRDHTKMLEVLVISKLISLSLVIAKHQGESITLDQEER